MMLLVALLAGAIGFAAGAVAATRRARRRKRRRTRTTEHRTPSRATTHRFVESATHELHTPLTAIMGYQELLADGIYGTLDPPVQEAVLRIGRSSHQLMALIDGILDAMSAEAGFLDLDLEQFPVDHLLNEIARAANEGGGEREVHVTLDPSSEAIILQSDRDRLRRALTLGIIAATRNGVGDSLHIAASSDDGLVHFFFHPTTLTEAMLHPDMLVSASSDRMSLRLNVAARIADALGGGVTLEPADEYSRLRITVAQRLADPELTEEKEQG